MSHTQSIVEARSVGERYLIVMPAGITSPEMVLDTEVRVSDPDQSSGEFDCVRGRGF